MNDNAPVLHISPAQLHAAAELILTRLPGQAESDRLCRARAMLRATAGLNRTLATYAQHALVHCHGSAGTSDLGADTAALITALQHFTAEITQLAALRDDLLLATQAAHAPAGAAE